MPSSLRLSPWLAALVCLTFAAGCTQLDLRQPLAAILPAGDKPQPPTKVVAVWTDALAQHPAKRATRGFGGRLMFFGRDPGETVRVDGTLVVYAFEGKKGKAKPDRKYVFKPEQFVNHYSESKLGHSYSVWIPWDEAGGSQQDVALVCRFDPVEGAPVVSEQALVTLPGLPQSIDAQDTPRASHVEYVGSKREPVQPAAHHAATADGDGRAQGDENQAGAMKTATIRISPQFGRLSPVARSRSGGASAMAQARSTEAAAHSGGGEAAGNPTATVLSAAAVQGSATPPPSTDY
jgi:hypothetical protein